MVDLFVRKILVSKTPIGISKCSKRLRVFTVESLICTQCHDNDQIFRKEQRAFYLWNSDNPLAMRVNKDGGGRRVANEVE